MLMRHLANLALRLTELSWAIPVEYTIVRSVDLSRPFFFLLYRSILSTMRGGAR